MIQAMAQPRFLTLICVPAAGLVPQSDLAAFFGIGQDVPLQWAVNVNIGNGCRIFPQAMISPALTNSRVRAKGSDCPYYPDGSR